VADKDDAGRMHALKVASALHGAAESVKVIECPDIGGMFCKDASDFLEGGGTASDLVALAEATPEWKPKRDRPEAIPLTAAMRLSEDDPAMLFKRRVLKCGESWLINGATGIGKSVLCVEAAILWSLGREYLGFEPTRPLRSLIFAAEDDSDEVAWFRDGVAKRHGLSAEDLQKVGESVHFVPVCDLTGREFIARDVRPNVEAMKPDLLHLNPALAYIGGEAKDQRQVGDFLRGLWQPVLEEFKAGSVVYHHTAKPPANRKDEAERYLNDHAYAGLGSVEWSNWSRGILTILPTATPGLFKLVAPKRGQRLAWKDDEGEPTSVRYIAHCREPGTLGWRDPEPGEVPLTGRPKSTSPDKVLGLLSKGPLKTKDWQRVATEELGVSRAKFFEVRASLEASGRIYSSPIDGWRIKLQTPKP
jgi:hypothetical protein